MTTSGHHHLFLGKPVHHKALAGRRGAGVEVRRGDDAPARQLQTSWGP